jgi:hypothetical protein
MEVDVLLALNRTGGVITDVRKKGEIRTAIGATIPTKNMAEFSAWLKNFSGGQGHISENSQ